MIQYINEQKYSECQLIVAINAAIYLGQPPVIKESNEYERLVDLVAARHGSAIKTEKDYEFLRIKKKPMEPKIFQIMDKIDEGHPVELHVSGTARGYHSILAIDYETITKDSSSKKYLKVLNFNPVCEEDGLMTWDHLSKIITRKQKPCCFYFYLDQRFNERRFIDIENIDEHTKRRRYME